MKIEKNIYKNMSYVFNSFAFFLLHFLTEASDSTLRLNTYIELFEIVIYYLP